MQNKLWIILALLVAFFAGLYADTPWDAASELGQGQASAPEPLYWVAPMDASFRSDKPGRSPMGMDLVPVYQDGSGDDAGDVRISPAIENNLGLKMAAVKMSSLQAEISTVGYVQFDEDRLHHVHLRVEGWIESLNISAEGEQVAEGEVLFELYSPTLFNAQKDMVSALKSGEEELITAARQKMRLLGMTADQIRHVERSRQAEEQIAFHAQHGGIVSNLNVRHGMFVDPAAEVMAIGAIDTVWVIADVFERQLPWLVAGQDVTMSVDSYPGQQWRAKVDYIYPVLNPESRTVQVRIRIDNQDRRLKPNMFASLTIHAQDSQQVLNIPRSALILGGRGARVVQSLGSGKYRSVDVVAGREAGDRVEVLEGLESGDKVVVSAQFLIDSESNIAAEELRMSPSEDGAIQELSPARDVEVHQHD